MSSLENYSNSKGKAVVKEEVSDPLTSVNVKQEEEVSLPIQDTAAPARHHQTPSNNQVAGSGGGNNGGVLGRRSSTHQDDVGSSAAAAAAAADMMHQASAMQWGALVAPTLTLPAFQPLDNGRILLIEEVMQQCVTALGTGDVVAANTALVVLSTLASVAGDPLQRVAFAFAEALGRRALQQMLPGIFGGLLQLDFPPQPAAGGCTGTTRVGFDALSPLLRVAASVANHAIIAAMVGERRVHVVDLGGANPNQWLELLHLLALRPEGKPSSLRLTVVSEEEGLLSSAAWLLHRDAARLHIPFVFNPVRSHIDRLSPPVVASFGVVPGEALAISSTLQLHRLIADVTSIELPAAPGAADHHHQHRRHAKKGKKEQQPKKHQITMADALLRALCDLSPKVMVLTEQEAFHNAASLGDRVHNAFDHYAALFNDLEAGGATRQSADRAAVERTLLREEIMDIVARDGSSRRERHESVMGWSQRMAMAGFQPMHLQVRRFDAFADVGLLALQLSIHGTLRYSVGQDNSCFIIYANMTPVFSVTAWQPAPTTTGE